MLFQTGCYADFTFPSAPDATQPGIVNEIYWPEGDLGRARAHERGRQAKVGRIEHDRILMIQGPLALTRRGRGLGVRIENGAITSATPSFYGANPREILSGDRKGFRVLAKEEDLARQLIDGSLVVDLRQTAGALRLIVERDRVVPEGAGAVATATALAGMAAGRLVSAVLERPSHFYPCWFYFAAETCMAAVLVPLP